MTAAGEGTYRVAVKDHVLIAHSLQGSVFGPAQRLHGATYTVTVELAARSLDANGIVVDIGEAQRALAAVLEPLRFRNLDDVKELAGMNTTTERLAQWLHGRLCERFRGVRGTLRVQLDESPVAYASYEAPLQGAKS